MESPREIDEKLVHLRSYVPFVERMITKLEARSQQVGSRNNQLERLQGLHRFLTTPVPRAPRMEMLEKMEAVIRNMHEKVQKATGKPEPGPSAPPRPPSHGAGPGQGPPSPNISSSHRPILGSHSNPGCESAWFFTPSRPVARKASWLQTPAGLTGLWIWTKSWTLWVFFHVCY